MTTTAPATISRFRTVTLAALLVGALGAGAWMLRRGTHVRELPPVRGSMLFEQVRSYVGEKYMDTIPESKLYEMAIAGMINELGDPYSVFLSADRVSRLSESTSGNYAGIGLQVDVRDGLLIVVNPLPGGPGDRAGILTGDRIVEIDGRVVRGLTPEEVQRLLRGKPGSSVAVTIEHPGEAATVKLTLEREAIHQSAVRESVMLPNNTAYVTLQVFSDSTQIELERAVNTALHGGATSLILDLRGNPGGLLTQGVRVTDLFLDVGDRVVSTRGQLPDANREYVDSTAQRWPKLPVVVLVDERTASAAELFAGALQDYDRALIVGSTTFGKGSAQSVFPIDGAGALKLTTARWFTPLGRSIARTAPLDDSAPLDTADERPEFKTKSGRTVLGGGGITPDYLVDDEPITPENLAFMQMLGRKVGQFRDALTSYALSLKSTRTVQSPNFVVTPAMLNDVYTRMQERGADVPRVVYDDVRPLVSRLLSYEIARYVFGAEAEVYRKAMDDKAVRDAQRMLAGITSQSQLFERAKRESEARAAERRKADGG